MRTIPLGLLLASLLAGCNWTHFAEFRAQMRAIRQYTHWNTSSPEPVFVFKSPVLTAEDLTTLGIYFERVDEQHGIIRYGRITEPGERAVDCDIELLFSQGRLAGVGFPHMLQDTIGREHIEGFFAMIGGGHAEVVDTSQGSNADVVSRGLADATPGPLVPELTLTIVPRDMRNRRIILKMSAGDRADRYSRFYVKLEHSSGS